MTALFGDPEPAPLKWTERMLLDLLRRRYSRDHGNGPRFVFAEHVRSEAGFGEWSRDHFQRTGNRTTLRVADAVAVDLWPSSGNVMHGFEVKVSRSDWLTELRDPTKHEPIAQFCDHWWLVVPDAKIAHDGVPDGWGLLAVTKNGRGLRVHRPAPRRERVAPTPSFLAALLRAAQRGAP